MNKQIILKILNEKGEILSESPAGERTGIVYTKSYQPGDMVSMELSVPGQFCVVQFEDTMQPALIYAAQKEIGFPIPFGETASVYSPKSFTGELHAVRARIALPEETAARRNLAFNPYDRHGDTGYFPHASANVETRGEMVFAARNAIDGIFENNSHGTYPYESWGINRDPNAALTLNFGRSVLIDELRITLRADYPHDNYWTEGTVTFINGNTSTDMKLPLTNSPYPQCFRISPKKADKLIFHKLIKAEGPSPFPALTQIEAWGKDFQADDIHETL